jgi:cysteinyl-tRNA synthetase
VYDFAHIGNFRAFLTYDVLKRWLTYLGYEVDHVCNLTDIDDKIIARMQRDGVSLKELTEKYVDAWSGDYYLFNFNRKR